MAGVSSLFSKNSDTPTWRTETLAIFLKSENKSEKWLHWSPGFLSRRNTTSRGSELESPAMSYGMMCFVSFVAGRNQKYWPSFAAEPSLRSAPCRTTWASRGSPCVGAVGRDEAGVGAISSGKVGKTLLDRDRLQFRTFAPRKKYVNFNQ